MCESVIIEAVGMSYKQKFERFVVLKHPVNIKHIICLDIVIIVMSDEE